MFRRVIVSLPMLICLAEVAGRSDAATRVALVSTCGGEVGADSLALAEARLSQVPEVAVVERIRVERVLTEQKLWRCGLGDTEQALTVGKLLGVEVFAALETIPDSEQALGLVIFDASTGAKLRDTALSGVGAEALAESMVSGIRGACLKRNDSGKALRTVCISSVRNADLPRELDSLCDALGELLERNLVDSPAVTVLERRRLQQVNLERALPTESATNDLLVSLTLVELEVARAQGKEKLQVTAYLVDPSGTPVGKAVVTGSEREGAADLAEALTKELLKMLKLAPSDYPRDRGREAERFMNEAKFLTEHGDLPAALRAIEAAAALNPSQPLIRQRLAACLFSSASDVLNRGKHRVRRDSRKATTFEEALREEAVERWVPLADRAFDVATSRTLNVVSATESEGLEILIEDARVSSALTEQLETILKLYKDQSKELIIKLAAIQRRYQNYLRGLGQQRVPMFVKNRENFSKYSLWLADTLLQYNLYLPATTNDWTSDTVAVLSPWLELSKSYRAEWDGQRRVTRMLAGFTCRRRKPYKLPVDTDAVEMKNLIESMGKHPDPVVRMYSMSAQLWRERQSDNLSTNEAMLQAQAIRKFGQDALDSSDLLEASDYRPLLYQAALDAIGLIPGDAGQISEYRELLHFMLDHNEIINEVVINALRRPDHHGYMGDPPSHPITDPEIIEDLQRIREVLNRPDSLVLDASKISVQGRLALWWNRVQPAQASSPSERQSSHGVEVLFRASSLKNEHLHVLGFQGAVVSGQSIYAVVAGTQLQDGGVWAVHTNQLQLVRISLTDGAVALLGKIDYPHVGWDQEDWHAVYSSVARSACLCEGKYYLATHGYGILAFPVHGSAGEQIGKMEGLPSETVTTAACLGDRLYAGFQEGYLIACNTRTKTCEVVASSRRKAKQTPLDNSTPSFTVRHMLADPDRHRVLFTIDYGQSDDQNPLAGIWQIDATSGALTQVLKLYGYCRFVGATIKDHVLVRVDKSDSLGLSFALFRFNLQTDHADFIAASGQGPAGPILRVPESVTPLDYWKFLPPYLVADGWLWFFYRGKAGTADLSRLSSKGVIDTSLPPLSPGDNSYVPYVAGMQLLGVVNDGKQVLVADKETIWLLNLDQLPAPSPGGFSE